MTTIERNTTTAHTAHNAYALIFVYKKLEDNWVAFANRSLAAYLCGVSTIAEAEAEAQAWLDNQLEKIKEDMEFSYPDDEILIKVTEFTIVKEYKWA